MAELGFNRPQIAAAVGNIIGRIVAISLMLKGRSYRTVDQLADFRVKKTLKTESAAD